MENEFHFLYSCPSLQMECTDLYSRCIDDIASFMLMSDKNKTKYLLTEAMIKLMGAYVETIYLKGQKFVYKPIY